jgi:molybdopterin synthase catalytic subunit
MLGICKDMVSKHAVTGIAMIHRLGTVPIGEESILIAVSTPHRKAAWLAGEESLELCKEKVEVWKLEEFGGEEPGLWRANRDGQAGVPVTLRGGGGDDDGHGNGVRLEPEGRRMGPTGMVSRARGEGGHGPVVNPYLKERLEAKEAEKQTALGGASDEKPEVVKKDAVPPPAATNMAANMRRNPLEGGHGPVVNPYLKERLEQKESERQAAKAADKGDES